MFNFFRKKNLKDDYVLIVASATIWNNKEKWESLLTYYDTIFKSCKLKVDVDDPLLRGAKSVSETASFIAEKIASGESAIFGEYEIEARFTIENATFAPLDQSYSRLVLTLLNLEDPSTLLDILEKTALHLDAFYGVAETKGNFAAWKKKKVIWGIDYTRELPGVMKHTYFSKPYVKYFGVDKFNLFSPLWIDQGVIITLSFNSIRQRLKEGDRAARLFGVKSFVDHNKILPEQKKHGEYVLSMIQLKNEKA